MNDNQPSHLPAFEYHWIQFLSWICIIFVTLLWVQFPLRILSLGIHRLINDMAQILFAYIWVFGFILASVNHHHLQVSVKKHGFRRFRLIKLITLPCALFLIDSSWPIFIQSWKVSERFSDTLSPGFYLIKLALILFSGSIAIMSLRHFIRPHHAE